MTTPGESPLPDMPPVEGPAEAPTPEEFNQLTTAVARRIVRSADPHAMDEHKAHLDALADPDRPGESGAQQVIGGAPTKTSATTKVRKRGIGGHGPDAADDPRITFGEPDPNPPFTTKEEFFAGRNPASAKKWIEIIKNRDKQT